MGLESANDSLIEMDDLRKADATSNVSGDEDDLTQLIPREISVKQLMVYLAGDIQRTRNYKAMPLYLIFLAIFTSMLIAVNMSYVMLNPDFYFNRAAKRAMELERMQEIKERSEIWGWLKAATGNVWLRTPKGASTQCDVSFEYHTSTTIDPARSARSTTTAPNGLTLDGCCGTCFATPDCVGWVYDNKTASCSMYEGVALMSNPVEDLITGVSSGNGWHAFFPITLFVVRQWRVPLKECDLSAQKFLVVPKADRYNIDGMSGCVSHYETDSVTTDTFGEARQFVSELTAHRMGGPPPLATETYTSTSTDRDYAMGEAFAITFPFSQNYDIVSAHLDKLEAEHWIDGQTRAVSVDTIFFDPELNSFVHFKGMLEFFVTGAVVTSARSMPFSIWSFATPVGGVLFAIDIIIVLFVLAFALDTFMARRQFRKIAWITDRGPPVWEVFEVMNLVTFFLTYYARGQMWREGFELFQRGHIEEGVADLGNCTQFCEERVQFTALATYSSQSYQSASWFAPSIILAYLRLFKFLQHNVRMNALSETIKEARGDLVGMGLIFMIVSVGYSVAGTLLFAHEFEDFQTFFSTTSYLVRVIFTGEMSLWDDMTRVSHPLIVAAFMLSWFVICWLVLLNMILAVIAGAFSVVQENMQARQSSKRSITSDVKNYVLKYLLCCPQIQETGDPESKKPSTLLYKFFGGAGGDRSKKKTFSKGWGSRYILRRLNTLIALREYYEQKKKNIGAKVEWERLFLTERVLMKIMRWARANGDEVLNDYEIAAAFSGAMEQTMGDQIALRVGERSIERMMNKMEDFERKLEQANGNVSRLHTLVDDQGRAIDTITAQSSHTVMSVDKMGARVKQAVVTVSESAEAVGNVATQQSELLTTTQDIAAAVETEHQNRAPVMSGPPPRRGTRRQTSGRPASFDGSVSLSTSSVIFSPTDAGVKNTRTESPKDGTPKAGHSTQGQSQEGAYSWD